MGFAHKVSPLDEDQLWICGPRFAVSAGCTDRRLEIRGRNTGKHRELCSLQSKPIFDLEQFP